MYEKRKVIDHSWREWLNLNVSRRCAPESLIADMVKNDFDPVFARETIMEAFSFKPPVALWAGQKEIVIDGHVIAVVQRLDRPQVIELDNVLTSEECDELIAYASTRLRPSSVVDESSGKFVDHKERISDSAFLKDSESELLTRLATRASVLMQVPVSHGEDFQVVRYKPGGEYRAHYDYFPPAVKGSQSHLANGGNRTSTLLMYLNDVESGGATTFPLARFAKAPRKGSALLFRYMNDKGRLDEQSLHAGEPVFIGEKWIVTKWMRERPRVS